MSTYNRAWTGLSQVGEWGQNLGHLPQWAARRALVGYSLDLGPTPSTPGPYIFLTITSTPYQHSIKEYRPKARYRKPYVKPKHWIGPLRHLSSRRGSIACSPGLVILPPSVLGFLGLSWLKLNLDHYILCTARFIGPRGYSTLPPVRDWCEIIIRIGNYNNL